MGHTDAKKWYDSLSNAQIKHIQKSYSKPVFGFSNSEKSNLMKQYQHDPIFLSLQTIGDKNQQQSPTDWTTNF